MEGPGESQPKLFVTKLTVLPNCVLPSSLGMPAPYPNVVARAELPDTANKNTGLRYRYTMEYYSAIKRNTAESVLMRRMKLESIIQSEVSQKDKNKYYILTHMYEI